jgi:DNA polymerase I-like protein with 3'-5' exonuclease and polymerase domains
MDEPSVEQYRRMAADVTGRFERLVAQRVAEAGDAALTLTMAAEIQASLASVVAKMHDQGVSVEATWRATQIALWAYRELMEMTLDEVSRAGEDKKQSTAPDQGVQSPNTGDGNATR